MGCEMNNVMSMELRETVTVDPDRLVELCVTVGEMRAEAIVASAVEELSLLIVEAEEAYRSQNFDALILRANEIEKTASNVGMTTFARVADDVIACAGERQTVPLASTLNRLRRIADKSLSAVWDMQDMSC